MNYLHRAWAEINLDALIHNFKTIRSMTDSKIFSVVKANAYGHSVSLIAKTLDELGTDYFAVSNIDEARELRNLEIKKPILILGYTPPFLAEELIRYDIAQAVFSLEYAEKLSEFALHCKKRVKAHLKLDTGMGRIGFDCRTNTQSGLDEAKAALSLGGLDYEGVFTHFPVADTEEKQSSEYTRLQFERFMGCIAELEADGFNFKIKHCCNSGATLLYKDMHLDAIRPGLILYGLIPSAEVTQNYNLLPVMTFKATVSMVKTMNKDETISYGRTYKIEKPTKIATITAGYADGLPRLLSSKGYVLINGKRAAITGRICMDQFCADVTHIDDVKEGDTVILFGKGLPVTELADIAETINYEIVCGLSKRVPRIYIKDGKELDE